MAIIKCKMCGGDIELTADKTFGTCEYCGSTMTFPKIDDEQRAAAFNRGNHFRRIGEFDKALQVYERIVREDDTDAEAHWCCALCRFGIEYVEDPATLEYLPTCHRASFDSFLEDVDYLAALNYSEGITKRQYQKDGNKIAEVQRGILATSQNAEPYDVFICYKETDASGERTRDSLLAQDIYYQLTEQGKKVFFARITLEDVAGREYEPYIFAALNSAKVMIVVGTKPEHLSAVWVKNEWSRFLSMMKKDHSKLLLPCYRDMDPYDMPEQLSVLQSYDMSKIGFIQDLIRGINKVLEAEKKPEVVREKVVVQQAGGSANIAPLLKRAFMFLEDGDWDRADEFCEQVLNLDPENADAYLGKLMAELRVTKQENLKNCAQSFEKNSNYQKATRFGDEKLKNELTGYIEHINTRNEEDRKDEILAKAKGEMRFGCIPEQEKASQLLRSIPGWKDADEQLAICQKKLKELKDKEEAERLERERQREIAREKEKRKKRIKTILTAAFISILVAAIAFVIILNSLILPGIKYGQAVSLKNSGDIAGAAIAFGKLDDFWDSEAQHAALWDDIAVRETVSAGYSHTVCLKADGTVMAVGDVIYGQCSVSSWKNIVAISAGAYHTVGLKANGTVVATGWDKYGTCDVSSWEDIVAISAGDYYTVGLKADGTAVATGDNPYHQCDVSDWKDIVAISAGESHTVGLKSNGTAVATGKNNNGQCNVSDWKDIVAVSAGAYHTVGLKADGTVVAMGYDAYGQCDVSSWKDIVAISAGDYHTVGLKKDGTVVAVGYNGDGRCDVSGWKDIVAISAGGDHTVGLKKDGTVVAVGDNTYGRCDVSGWKNIKQP